MGSLIKAGFLKCPRGGNFWLTPDGLFCVDEDTVLTLLEEFEIDYRKLKKMVNCCPWDLLNVDCAKLKK